MMKVGALTDPRHQCPLNISACSHESPQMPMLKCAVHRPPALPVSTVPRTPRPDLARTPSPV